MDNYRIITGLDTEEIFTPETATMIKNSIEYSIREIDIKLLKDKNIRASAGFKDIEVINEPKQDLWVEYEACLIGSDMHFDIKELILFTGMPDYILDKYNEAKRNPKLIK